MELAKYELLETFNAPEAEASERTGPRKRLFKSGRKVIGYVNKTDQQVPPHIIVEQKWCIPASKVRLIGGRKGGPAQASVNANGNDTVLRKEELPKGIQKSIARITTGELGEEGNRIIRATMSGALVGFGGGAGYALLTGRPWVRFGLIGALIGVILFRLVANGKNKTNGGDLPKDDETQTS